MPALLTAGRSTLERAFELARSGQCATLSDIRSQLKREGFTPREIEGGALTRQLRELCRANRPRDEASAKGLPQ